MKNVSGKTALITGGARGMGKHWVEHLLADGAKIVIWDLDEAALQSVKLELSEKFHTEIKTWKTDISNPQEVSRCAAEVLKEFGNVDILINNAGIVSGGEFLKSDDAMDSKIIDVNLKAMFRTMKAFLPGMLQKGEGHIVNVSSASGLLGVPFMPAYTASKWGVIGLTESVRQEMKELGIKGIHFTLLCPSYVNTGMFEGAKAVLFTSILNPEKFINKAYQAFKKNKYMVIEPWLIKLTPFLKGILPNSVFYAVSRLLGATGSMKEWKGRNR